jgi:hypothetical protein
MGTSATSTGLSDPSSNNAKLHEELQQAQLHQTQVQTQLQAQLLKQSKGPSTFRRVLGAVVGTAAGFFVPGLGGAIGSMIMGNNRPVVIPPGALPGTGPGAGIDLSAGLNQIEQAMQQNQAAMEKTVQSGIQNNRNEMAELAALPKGPDPVAFLALTEKTNEQSEIFQATSAVAKAKHEAAMAAIQNIKD